MKSFLSVLLSIFVCFGSFSPVFAGDEGQTESTKPTDGGGGGGEDEEPDCE